MLSQFRQFTLLTLNGAPVRSATERHADPEDKSSESVRKKAAKTIARVSFWMLSVGLALMSWSTPGYSASKDANTQSGRQDHSALAQLYQLQAAFHRAASVHDPVNGDSPEVIEQRIREMLSLWTEDGALLLSVGGALDGTYAGQGDPDDLSPLHRWTRRIAARFALSLSMLRARSSLRTSSFRSHRPTRPISMLTATQHQSTLSAITSTWPQIQLLAIRFGRQRAT
jgi:hypothetical protein